MTPWDDGVTTQGPQIFQNWEEILIMACFIVTPLNFHPLKQNQNREGREEIRVLHKNKR